MLLLKYLLLIAGIAMFVMAAGILSYDAYLLIAWQRRRLHPDPEAGVRVSQTKGTLAGTLYPGVHFVAPLIERVELFNTRDQLFTTGISEDAARQRRGERRSDTRASSACPGSACPGERGAHPGTRHHRPLPDRSQAPRLH